MSQQIILAAMRDFFDAWQHVDFPHKHLVFDQFPINLNGGIDQDDGINSRGEASINGTFDAAELARHIADTLAGEPRKRFNELSNELQATALRESLLTEYQKIWEREKPWPEGHSILTRIVTVLTDMSVRVEKDPTSMTALRLFVPLPDIGGVPVNDLVPQHLKPIFLSKVSEILYTRHKDAQLIHDKCAGQPLTQHTIDHANSLLQQLEQHRRSMNLNDQLWRVAARMFGVSLI